MTTSLSTHVFPQDLAETLRTLIDETGDDRLVELLHSYEQDIVTATASAGSKAIIEAFRDKLSTVLMDVFRITQKSEAFGLLYEINYRLFLAVITAKLRKFYFPLDPQDVLQDVFFNIYRYPHKFQADRDQAFRFWASMIIRNSVFKSARDKDREFAHEVQDEEIETRVDRNQRSPLGAAIREESERSCSESYIAYLEFYLAAYRQLSERERTALALVEIDGAPYKDAADRLGIRLENLKMVIFRARKKILRSLDAVQSHMEAWSPAEVGGQRLDAMAPAAMHRIARAQRASRSNRHASMEAGA
ncbi:MAG: sigma-70 family RNA polymerase sigma factor [Planctomycetes bacterium]|nr:sigma-70 family RNA polymerase sigma factor [Planctomycetota bacterium]MCB9916925.1 sigma-70 family RNA polymerase sigma factor [Planctomycetota bacterium]